MEKKTENVLTYLAVNEINFLNYFIKAKII